MRFYLSSIMSVSESYFTPETAIRLNQGFLSALYFHLKPYRSVTYGYGCGGCRQFDIGLAPSTVTDLRTIAATDVPAIVPAPPRNRSFCHTTAAKSPIGEVLEKRTCEEVENVRKAEFQLASRCRLHNMESRQVVHRDIRIVT